MLEAEQRHVSEVRLLLAAANERHDALLEKYHALRESGYSAPTLSPFPPDLNAFGPLTRAALADMSIGQSGIVKRKMREKATALWLEQRGQETQDEVVAIAVRRGETG